MKKNFKKCLKLYKNTNVKCKVIYYIKQDYNSLVLIIKVNKKHNKIKNKILLINYNHI